MMTKFDGAHIAKLQIIEQLLILPSAKRAYHLMSMLKAHELEPADIAYAMSRVIHDQLNQNFDIKVNKRSFHK